MNFDPFCPQCHRRSFLRTALAGSAALFTAPGAFAEALTLTPKSTEGPFYPDSMPLDTDNDLLILNDGLTPAVGEITHLGGVVMDSKSQPVRNALVEIWQVDNQGIYLHSKARGQDKRDPNFQSYGRFLTDSKGRYYFRTIKPPSYPGRTPHIHYAVSHKNKRVLTTQLYIEGEKQTSSTRPSVSRSYRSFAPSPSIRCRDPRPASSPPPWTSSSASLPRTARTIADARVDAEEGRNAPGGNRTPYFFSFRETKHSIKEVNSAVVSPAGIMVIPSCLRDLISLAFTFVTVPAMSRTSTMPSCSLVMNPV